MSEVNNSTLHQNNMEAKFKIEHPPIRFDSSDSFTEIRVSRTEEIEKPVEIFAKDSGKKDKNVEITPLDTDDIEVQLVLPHTNCMEAIFELVEPEILTEELEADKDTYTRSQRPYNVENYGKQNALSLLNSETDTRKTFVYFHLPLWFLPVVSVETKFRLYYRGVMSNEKLSLYTVNRVWDEYGTTQANEPSRQGRVTQSYTVNEDLKYIEFDVTETVNYWKTYPHLNFGFRLEIDDINTSLNFYSRESLFKPRLVAQYYDPEIKSVGRSNKGAELEIIYRNHRDKEAQINIKSAYENSDTEVQLLPYTKGDKLSSEDDVILTVSKPNTPVDIRVAIPKEDDRPVEIAPKLSLSSNMESELTITKDKIEAELDVLSASDVPVEILAREFREIPVEINSYQTDSIPVQIQASQNDEQEVEIDIVYADDSEQEVEIDVSTKHDTPAEIAVTKNQIETEIDIVYSEDSDTPVEIRPKVKRHDETPVEITTFRNDILVELVVPVLSDIPVDIRIKGWNDNDKETALTVIRDNIDVEILAKAILDDKEVVIWVQAEDEKEVVIHNKPHKDIETEIEVYLSDKKEVQIASTRSNVHAQIGVYFDGEREELVEITPSIRASEDRYVQISLRGEALGYAFIM